jgi:hypothetical protein
MEVSTTIAWNLTLRRVGDAPAPDDETPGRNAKGSESSAESRNSPPRQDETGRACSVHLELSSLPPSRGRGTACPVGCEQSFRGGKSSSGTSGPHPKDCSLRERKDEGYCSRRPCSQVPARPRSSEDTPDSA